MPDPMRAVDTTLDPLAELPAHFVRSASLAARFALTHWTDSNPDSLALCAIRSGTAVELMMLGSLAELSPAIIASNAPSKDALLSRLYLAGAPIPQGVLSPSQLRTISWQEAISALRTLHPQLSLDPDRVAELMAVRNAAVHAGLVDATALRTAVGHMASVLEAVLNVSGANRAKFWTADLLPLVQSLLLIDEEAVLARVKAKIAVARENFERLISSYSPAESEALLKMMEGSALASPADWDSRRIPCPACARTGWHHLRSVAIPVEHPHFYMKDGHLVFDEERLGIPYSFECRVCGLVLEGEELELDDLGEPVPLPRATLSAAWHALLQRVNDDVEA